MARLAIRSRAESPELKKAASSIEQAAWIELGYLNYTRAHYEHYQDLLDEYPEFQLCLIDEETGYPVAVANSVPFACSGPDDLPAEGWDWLVETAARTKRTQANMLGALAVSVPAVHRSKGYARVMIRSLLALAESKKLNGVVVPVRPTGKVRHPWVPIADYVTWKDDKGRHYDPWLRSHLASGGKIVGPCERSMTVHEPIGFWENWSKKRFEETGQYALKGGIAPVQIDVDRQTGTYEEPNVWMSYS
ncbi:MAG TPA: transferase [Methyloceanibacter sp.]|nr:transferase [Methyloceanibacter sp.]